MHGRSRQSLLAISLLIAATPCLPGQSERGSTPAFKPAAKAASPDFDLPVPFPGRLPQPPPVAPVTYGLAQLNRAAGIIFSGKIISIARAPASARKELETVAITFRVENSIRGPLPGDDLTIFQWMGLWSGGQRYRVGERLLVFLYPPSRLGLTSCVGGSLGRFAVDASGHVLLSAQQLLAFHEDPDLGGKSQVNFRDFARAVQRTTGEE